MKIPRPRFSLAALVLLPVMLIPVSSLAIYLFAAADEEGIIPHPLEHDVPFEPGSAFRQYWFAGDAELTSYRLEQARYGEMHAGTAMLMFVSEDFSLSALTKSDGRNGPKTPVLKVNFEKKFVTGIYPYSMLLTVASPLDVDQQPYPLKVSTSSQEWCGHTYTQLDWEHGRYALTEHSYFPGEGDQSRKLSPTLPEDAIWTRLRIAPEKLPLGSFEMIPGTFYARLRHKPLEPVQVTASRPPADSAGQAIYQIDYADGSRQLRIWHEDRFPYAILKWTEDYEEGFGPGARHFTTTATRMVTKKLAYWNHHTLADSTLRTEMGL